MAPKPRPRSWAQLAVGVLIGLFVATAINRRWGEGPACYQPSRLLLQPPALLSSTAITTDSGGGTPGAAEQQPQEQQQEQEQEERQQEDDKQEEKEQQQPLEQQQDQEQQQPDGEPIAEEHPWEPEGPPEQEQEAGDQEAAAKAAEQANLEQQQPEEQQQQQQQPAASQEPRPALVPPALPWQPVLSAGQLRRGLSFYGSGARMEAFVRKLMAGEAVTAVTIGGSVTRGHGASEEAARFPNLFFHFLNSSYPHSGHVFLNKGIGATNSGIYSVCLEKLVPQDADLVAVEFTFNEPTHADFGEPVRRGFEQLLRKLVRMPRAPAVIVLHHFAWYYSGSDALKEGLYFHPPEAQLSTLAQYYDLPSPSARNAVYREMQADVAPFKVSSVVLPGFKSLAGTPVPGAANGTQGDYFYSDPIHPSDVGHKVLAELLAGVVQTAVKIVAEDGGGGGDLGLPPPMIPGNTDNPTSLCAMQEDFKPVARAMSEFEYAPERPKAPDFVGQKWGYRGHGPGAWLELEVSTEETPGQPGANAATVHLGYLRSYERMALAKVECASGCTCQPSLVDGLWQDRVSLMQMHTFQVSQHPACVIRVTIVPRSADTPGGEEPNGSGKKFQVAAIMVAHTPLVVSYYAHQALDVMKSFNEGG